MTQRIVPDALSRSIIGTRGHWLERGISPQQLRTLVSSGELVQLRYGSYATRAAVDWARDDPRRTHVLYVYAAMDRVGRHTAASHESAAVMHDLALFRRPVDAVTLTCPPGKRRSGKSPGIAMYAAALPPGHQARMYQVPVTNPMRTAADLARTLPFMEAVTVVDSALNRELAAKSEILGIIEKCARWPGARQARRVLEFADPGAESVLESCGRVILSEHGVEKPQVQVTLRSPEFSYCVDLYWPRYKTIVEFDGLMKYKNQKDLHNQFHRDRVLRDAGYQVIHVTWHEIFRTPGLVVKRILTAFAATTSF